jgi:hypothetical protein
MTVKYKTIHELSPNSIAFWFMACCQSFSVQVVVVPGFKALLSLCLKINDKFQQKVGYV